jgi:Flp pilus assembly protein TadG
MPNTRSRKNEQGQITVLFAFAIVFLVLATGLAIDAGLCYVAKAKLSTAVDGACLAGMKSLGPLGQTTANSVATDIFYANYGPNPPIPTVTFPTDSSGNQQVKVAATTNVHTLFMQIVPALKTVPVGATAVATRAKLIMSVVVDRSGSMCGGSVPCKHGESGDLGGQALQAAVPTFVNNFDNTPNTGDEVGLVSFSSNATIDYSINYSFQSPIDSKITSMDFEGGTFGTGAGTGSLLSNTIGPPLSLGGLQNDGVTVNPGQNVIKVIVYFTDGLMNTIQDQFHCGGKSNNTLTLLNYGGQDNPGAGTYAVVLDPTQPYGIWGTASSSILPYDSKGDTCVDANGHNVTTFYSQKYNAQEQFLQTTVTQEAQYRANKTANTLRSESPHPNYIYTIGLGSSVNASTQLFLEEIANDPRSDTYNSNQTTGEFFYVKDCPSTPATTCNNEVLQVFQTIAAKILLRLTQ